jgi:hypothetical protein
LGNAMCTQKMLDMFGVLRQCCLRPKPAHS